MRIREIINEAGWPETPMRFKIAGAGEIIMSYRRGFNGKIDGAIFQYYDIRIDKDSPVFTVKIINQNIHEFDHLLSPNGKLIGKNVRIAAVKKYFLDGVRRYLNSFIRENSMNREITNDDILKMCPGLDAAMDKMLESCGLSHEESTLEEDTSVSMSPFKDVIESSELTRKR